jgi:hypothetical protein
MYVMTLWAIRTRQHDLGGTFYYNCCEDRDSELISLIERFKGVPKLRHQGQGTLKVVLLKRETVDY